MTLLISILIWLSSAITDEIIIDEPKTLPEVSIFVPMTLQIIEAKPKPVFRLNKIYTSTIIFKNNFHSITWLFTLDSQILNIRMIHIFHIIYGI